MKKEAERTEELNRLREESLQASMDVGRERIMRQKQYFEEINELNQKLEEAYSKMAKISADAAFVVSKALEIAKTEFLSIPAAEIEEGCLCETEEEAE